MATTTSLGWRSSLQALAILTGTLLGAAGAWGGEGPQTAREAERLRTGVAAARDALAPLIRAAQKRFQIPGMSVVLVRGSEMLWAEGFGLADVAGSQPATADTRYRAGSLAKPMTAIAVMQLTEAGLVAIDQPLARYLPAFSIHSRFDTTAAPITVRSVLSHHAGLPTDLNKGMWTDQPLTTVASELRKDYACFPPNLVFSYSNVGYTLLGHLVQEVSGVPYAEHMRERVFQPLGMAHSAFRTRAESGSGVAKGYRDGREMKLLPIRDLPAAGLSTSATDLGRFLRAMLTNRQADGAPFLKAETLREIFAPQNQDIELDLDLTVGLGWFLETDGIPGGGVTIRHGGTTLGFSAELILLPEQDLGVAVLANGDGSRDVTAQLAEEILVRTLAVNPAPLTAAQFVGGLERRRGKGQAAALAGTYATDFGLIAIRPKDAKLCACMVDQTFDLIPYPNGWFGLNQDAALSMSPSLRPLADMRFQTQHIDGRDVVVAMQDGKRILLGEKVPVTTVPEIWRRRVGRYQLLNPDPGFPLTEPQIKLRDGQLSMSYKLPVLSPKTIEVPLQPISDTEAIILGLGRMRGETLRALVVDGEERLRYSGFEGRQLGGTLPVTTQ